MISFKLPTLWIVLAASLLSMKSFSKTDAIIEIVTPKGTKNFTLRELKAKLKSQAVEIDDPVAHQKVTYDAFPLVDVLALGGAAPNATADEIVFTAKDGYSPNTSFDQLKKHTAYLAYGVHGMGDGAFEKVAQGKAMVSPGPYYVVWKEGSAVENEVPWPYQLAKIEVVQFQSKYPKLYPQNAAEGSAEKRGFLVFKSQCIRCHSINLEGGDLGPELNVPKNVTEYWDHATLKAFIRNSGAFRARDKMPPFPQLTDQQLDDVLAYLTLMKSSKIDR